MGPTSVTGASISSSFVTAMHDTIRPILQPVIQQELSSKSTKNEDLPQSFSLHSLPVKLTTICEYIGCSDVLASNHLVNVFVLI
jgi:hypothetical protein